MGHASYVRCNQFAMLLNGREIGRRTGFAMVAGYFFYMAYLYL